MSKKRTSDESCRNTAEEQTNNDAAPVDVSQDEDNAKRVKLTPFINDTTLQDLPIEIIECILIRVVATEVKSMKLAKSVWTEKAELVINRLSAVCLQWNSVLSTVVFRNRLDRALEDHGTIRLEILQQHTIPFGVSCATALRDEVFILCRQQPQYINVYNWNNMAEATYVIPLPVGSKHVDTIVACNVSNCVYIVNRKPRNHYSILRITGDSDPRWSTLSEVISDIILPECQFCVTANGSLILSRKQSIRIPAISVYDATGSLQQTIRLPSDITEFDELIPKPNGNLVLRGSHLSYCDEDDDDDNDSGDNDDDDDDDNDDNGDDDDNDDKGDDDVDVDVDDDDNGDDNDDYVFNFQATLTEIDMKGTKISQYLISLGDVIDLDLHSSVVDSHGRMMAVSESKGMQLLDSEFNLMDFTGPQLIGPGLAMVTFLAFHYNSDRNETVMIDKDDFLEQADLTVFRLEEEL